MFHFLAVSIVHYTLHPMYPLNPKPQILNPKPEIQNPKPKIPKPLNPKP